MLRLQVLADGIVQVRHDLLVIKLSQKASEVAPVVQPVHFPQAGGHPRQYLLTGCRENIQDCPVKIACYAACGCGITDFRQAFKLLVVACKGLPFRAELMIGAQRSK